jgi:hypothetical protein
MFVVFRHQVSMRWSIDNINRRESLPTTIVLVLVVMATLAACGSRSSATPQDATRAFARAAQDGDFEEAHSYLSADLREKFSVAELRTLLESDSAPVSLDALYELSARPAALRAAGTIGAYTEVEWVYADGRWLLAGSEFWRPDTTSPRATLRTFVQGIEARNWGAVRATAPESMRNSLTDDVLAKWVESNPEQLKLITELAQSADAMPLQERGARAWLRYRDTQLSFAKEESGWVILEFE